MDKETNGEPKVRVALVLGATGGIGGAIASALVAHGWLVRGMARDLEAAKRSGIDDLEWRKGDAMSASDVLAAAHGADVIVHAVNPPGYRKWEELVLPMIDNTIAAALANGARIVLPGTVYNFDPELTPVVRSGCPQTGRSRKGQVRIALEKRLKDAALQVPSLIVRAGDYFGPGARSSWFTQAMIKPGRPLKAVTNVARGAGHSWSYLPDVAEAVAQLLEKQSALAPFEDIPFEGYWDRSGRGLIDGLESALGRKLAVRAFPWWLMRMASPLVPFAREASEIEPLWRHSMRLDNERLVSLLGKEPRTDLVEALRATLGSVACLPEQKG